MTGTGHCQMDSGIGSRPAGMPQARLIRRGEAPRCYLKPMRNVAVAT